MADEARLQAIERPPNDWKLGDLVYERVLTLILEGGFPENTKLPPEKTLSEQLGVSRPVLRQALKQLREDGVIISRQGSGSYVHRRPDGAVLKFAPVGSIADILRTFEFRATIESEAAALAAKRWKAGDMENFKAALDALDTCIRDGSLGTDADEDFHAAICAATDNHYFVSARSSMKTQIMSGMNLTRRLSLTRPAERLKLVQDEHYKILDALQARDEAGARNAMRQHVENARQRVFEGTPTD